MSDTSTPPYPTTNKKLNFISKKQSVNYFTVKQQPFQIIYITLNLCICRPDDKFIGIDTKDNYSETI